MALMGSVEKKVESEQDNDGVDKGDAGIDECV